jgi:anti-sigma regulatory factor (Ser/Thr protein kinase)
LVCGYDIRGERNVAAGVETEGEQAMGEVSTLPNRYAVAPLPRPTGWMIDPQDPRSAWISRRAARSTLRSWKLDLDHRVVDDVLVILSELVTNVFKHTRAVPGPASVTLGIEGDGALVLAVHDAHPLRPAALLVPYNNGTEGNGLMIVKRMVQECAGSIRFLPNVPVGKTIQVCLPLPSGAWTAPPGEPR